MIINFKIFENIGSQSENWKKFWIVDNTDKYFEVRLFKIGMTFEIIEKFKKFLLKNFDEKFRHYYFGYDSKLKKWSYENYNYTSGSNIYVDSFYKFMDHVKINRIMKMLKRNMKMKNIFKNLLIKME